MGFHVPLWRGIAVFRAASLLYAGALLAQNHELLARPWLAWTVLVVMAGWTALSSHVYVRRRYTGWEVLATDLTVAFGCLGATAFAVEPSYVRMAPPLTATWFAGAALATAVICGRRGALAVALGYGVVDVALRVSLGTGMTSATVRGVVLLILAGYAVGYMAHYMSQAERKFAQAVEMEARTAERERLARSIHDSVLQVLAMVQRRGLEIGGETAELGRMAGQQEEKLRSLVGMQEREPPTAEAPATPAARSEPEEEDLRSLLRAHASTSVTVSAPATGVPLPPSRAREVDAAVQAALDNVRRHCPPETGVWILAEDEGDRVTVTVRDEGPGTSEARLEEAAAHGRLGVAQSIRGRVRDLGGWTTVTTAPQEGTEIEMCVPR
ncbi:signal transduction histidine kinase [Haloactinospora alba]|uniref:Signal transduction histidine kinase n=1 Tax=Haloactinospora alba TaxID=405555 RepID=A0A543NJQ9_9ACTN|nr:DUF5931 domain-containing protein [Haloactinospora alba]TQN32010.1 signal transduction histidine kinase [Haloactinospora alba]